MYLLILYRRGLSGSSLIYENEPLAIVSMNRIFVVSLAVNPVAKVSLQSAFKLQ